MVLLRLCSWVPFSMRAIYVLRHVSHVYFNFLVIVIFCLLFLMNVYKSSLVNVKFLRRNRWRIGYGYMQKAININSTK